MSRRVIVAVALVAAATILQSGASHGAAPIPRPRNGTANPSRARSTPARIGPLFVENPFIHTAPTQRLDLVLTRGAVEAQKADLVGQGNVTPLLPMPSDHVGLVVTLKLQ